MRDLEPLKDTDLLNFGKKHQNTPLINVPDDYLLWMWEQPFIQKPTSDHNARLKLYIETNLESIKENVKRNYHLKRY